MTSKTKVLIAASALEILGFILLMLVSWKIAVGVFLWMWGTNLSNKYR